MFIMGLRMCVTHGGLNAVSCCRTASTRDTAMAYWGTLRAGSESESVQVCKLPARSCQVVGRGVPVCPGSAGRVGLSNLATGILTSNFQSAPLSARPDGRSLSQSPGPLGQAPPRRAGRRRCR
jgi:hypothetical protein